MPQLTSLLADWVSLNEQRDAVSSQTMAEALVRACAGLPEAVLRSLPTTPDDAAAAIADEPFAGRADGVYLPAAWLESFCAALRLPLAEVDNGWDVSDGESVYFCPIVPLADDTDSPDDTRPFIRLDQIRRWPEPA